jgi:VIT1/CCC1 family predicted Fe2+/Mn2+ transporter
MPFRRRHVERHFQGGDTVRDIVIGMADGLTVPFALAAGLSGAVASNGLIITAGLAEIAAGAIAMGLGGFLAAHSQIEHYLSERKREVVEVQEVPEEEKREVRDVFRTYGLTDEEIAPILTAFQSRPKDWVNFMMRFELGIEKPDKGEALKSAVTIGGSYIVGGLVPLCPYFFVGTTHGALELSIVATASALFLFGFIKARFTGSQPLLGGLQTLLVGALAAAAAYGIARAISHTGG